MQAQIIATTVIAVAFALLVAETAVAMRRQEHYEYLLARADRVRALRRADRKRQVAQRKANSFHAVQYVAGEDSAATKLARDGYLEAAWDAPVALPHPHIGADGTPHPCTHPEICAADEAEFTREGDLR